MLSSPLPQKKTHTIERKKIKRNESKKRIKILLFPFKTSLKRLNTDTYMRTKIINGPKSFNTKIDSLTYSRSLVKVFDLYVTISVFRRYSDWPIWLCLRVFIYHFHPPPPLSHLMKVGFNCHWLARTTFPDG